MRLTGVVRISAPSSLVIVCTSEENVQQITVIPRYFLSLHGNSGKVSRSSVSYYLDVAVRVSEWVGGIEVSRQSAERDSIVLLR